MIHPNICVLLTAFLIGGCAASGPADLQSGTPKLQQATSGTALVLDQPAQAILALLGGPKLDRQDRGARQLQFIAAGCVIDIYLYAKSAGAEAVATYAEARRNDGSTMDAGQCIDAQRAARAAPPPVS